MPSTKKGSRPASDDAGFTLIELMVYSMLLLLVMGIVGSLLISSLMTERAVRSTNAAAAQGQLAADSIATGIRNSTRFVVTSPRGGDLMISARTVGRGAEIDRGCAAWYYSAGDPGSIRYREAATAIAVPSPTSLESWTLLAEGVGPVAGRPVFDENGPDVLAIAFNSLATDEPSVLIESSAVARAGLPGGATCF